VRGRIATIAVVVWVWLGCSGVDEAPLDPGTPDPPPPEPPTLSTALAHRCFGWPADEFTLENRAPTQIGLSDGDLAVDFELKDLGGNAYGLSELLATKPVLLVNGSYT
jgi:hypothetical protein